MACPPSGGGGSRQEPPRGTHHVVTRPSSAESIVRACRDSNPSAMSPQCPRCHDRNGAQPHCGGLPLPPLTISRGPRRKHASQALVLASCEMAVGNRPLSTSVFGGLVRCIGHGRVGSRGCGLDARAKGCRGMAARLHLHESAPRAQRQGANAASARVPLVRR